MEQLFLYQDIANAKRFIQPSKLPDFISDNLADKIVLRDYQIQALEDTILYLTTEQLSKNKRVHLLYHMATGSGKTVIMAGLILYYYSLGYRNFLFFTNQSSIVNKTKINFTDKTSGKYLFANEIIINNQHVKINIVSSFQHTNDTDINICFDTVQGIHTELFFAKENSLTIDDFINKKVVMLADEAHHLNSLTAHSDKEVRDAESTWENTVSKIFNANRDNVLFEFTATCNLKDQNILDKYIDKIVFNFPLKEFREAGYTKEFNNFSSDTSPWVRTLQALIMSEYRKLMFDKHNIYSKPIVMLKSMRISESKKFYIEFFNNLKNLNAKEINDIRKSNSGNSSTYISLAFAFFDTLSLTSEDLVEMIKLDFSEEHAVSMNGEQTDDDEIYRKVNTLDDFDNPYRLIFTVAKLNEGWDVLSLYDIVRLHENRVVGKNNTPSDFTMSEAQLIGRGARYFPFVFSENQVPDRKKYTNNIDNPESICETLLYHSMNDARYINELKQALIKTGFEPDIKVPVEIVLKDEFKKSEVYREGYIFINRKVEKSRKNVVGMPERIRTQNFSHHCSTGIIKDVRLFDESSNADSMTQMDPIKLKDVQKSILFKAYRCFSNTLSFEKLIVKFPNLKSVDEFLTSSNYLGDVTITFKTYNNIKPTNDDYLNACLKVLQVVSDYVTKIEIQYEGTKEFVGKPIHEIIPERRTRLISKSRLETESWGEGISQNDFRVPDQYKIDLMSKGWYAFDDNKGSSEEKKFVAYFNTVINDLKKKYKHIFLIRNELFFSLYSFKTGATFEPDYILILRGENDNKESEFLCVFVEPKGENLLLEEKWKEDFMLEMESEAVPVYKFACDDKYLIWGTPFYNESATKDKFIEYVYTKKIF